MLTVTNADQGEIKVNVNNTYTILTKTTFNNQTIDAVLSFSSTDEQIVSVDNNGKITANKVGEAIIEITGSWREFVGGEIFTSVKVIVKDDKPYWYVGIASGGGNLKALLIDGFSGEVLAIREIF